MLKRLVIRAFPPILLMAAMLVPACQDDAVTWKPATILTMEPDSGLTTQTFNIRVNMLNLPVSQKEFYLRWDFDGDSVWDSPYSAQPEIIHRFYQKGRHNVRVTILTEDGQELELSKMVNIGQGYSPPHAGFTIDPPIGNYLNSFTFDASKTFDDEDSFSSLLFRWDFENDGIWDTESSNNPIAKFRYPKAANYTVKLSVTDPTRRIASVTQNLEVNIHEDLIKPVFTRTPQEATVKDTFHFDASATHHATDPDRTFTYTWYVKSENTYGPFKEPVFNHVFWASGTQEVKLTATDQYGLSNSFTESFYVIKENKPPTPGIELSTPYGNINTNFYISAWPSRDDVDAPSELLCRWDFEGDGTWDTGWSYDKELFHQFTTPGTFWITLEAEDTGGERATVKIKIMVSTSSAQTSYIRDKRDSKYYGTVKIGDQWWMSDNLSILIDPKLDMDGLQFCMDEQYGCLYRGDKAVDFVNAGYVLCPIGWRLPSKEDWLKLREHIPARGGRDAMIIGGSLGFNVRKVGKDDVSFLSSTQRRRYAYETQMQFYMGLQNDFEGVDFLWGDLKGYYYVRCIKNE